MVRVGFVILFAFIYFAPDLSKMPLSSFPKNSFAQTEKRTAPPRDRWPTTAAITSSQTRTETSTRSVLVQLPATGTVKSAHTGTSLPVTSTQRSSSASSQGTHFMCGTIRFRASTASASSQKYSTIQAWPSEHRTSTSRTYRIPANHASEIALMAPPAQKNTHSPI